MWTGLAFALLLALSGASFVMARGRAGRLAAGGPSHSRPVHHGAYVALWVGVPAALVLLFGAWFGGRIEQAVLSAEAPAAVSSLPVEQREAFWRDARILAAGGEPTGVYSAETTAALAPAIEDLDRLERIRVLAFLGLASLLALAGFSLSFPRIAPAFRARNRVEGWMSVLLVGCATAAVLTTVGIIASLSFEAFRFFRAVSPADFLFGLEWSPQIAMRSDQVAAKGAFGAVPLFAGTMLVTVIALMVAAPIGLYSAIYLSEYAGSKVRSTVKPLLEVLAGVPTVVYGFFAALTVGPVFRAGFNALGARLDGTLLDGLGQYLMQVQNQMALTAGVVMGVMLIPFISSLSDDVINAVPQSLRDGSFALGATRSETVKKVVLPAALPGVAGAILLAVSRAIGETMIVTMAAGLQAKLTANPLDTVTTVTVQIVTLLTGDQEFDSPKTLAAFGLGLTLFVVTLGLNVIALSIVQRFRERYD